MKPNTEVSNRKWYSKNRKSRKENAKIARINSKSVSDRKISS